MDEHEGREFVASPSKLLMQRALFSIFIEALWENSIASIWTFLLWAIVSICFGFGVWYCWANALPRVISTMVPSSPKLGFLAGVVFTIGMLTFHMTSNWAKSVESMGPNVAASVSSSMDDSIVNLVKDTFTSYPNLASSEADRSAASKYVMKELRALVLSGAKKSHPFAVEQLENWTSTILNKGINGAMGSSTELKKFCEKTLSDSGESRQLFQAREDAPLGTARMLSLVLWLIIPTMFAFIIVHRARVAYRNLPC